MSGTGYDYSVVQFSPEGRVYQTEYAEKAADKGDTTVAVKCVDGVVIAVEKTVASKLLKPGANPHLLPISPYHVMAVSGLQPDGRALAQEGKAMIKEYENQYGTEIPNQTLANRLAGKVHNCTIYGNERPYGCTSILAMYNPQDGPQVYMITPNADCYRYFGICAGKHKQGVNTELEKIDYNTITCAQAVEQIAHILYKVWDDVKDKPFEYEVLWLHKDNKYKLAAPPKDLVDKAVTDAKAAKQRALMDDDVDE
eukprot:UN04527